MKPNSDPPTENPSATPTLPNKYPGSLLCMSACHLKYGEPTLDTLLFKLLGKTH